MPLISRIPATKPHTIWEFQTAASLRYSEGKRLAAAGDRLSAIYLWGYTTEMVLKAAYFRLTGWRSRQPFTKSDLDNAKAYANRTVFPMPPPLKWWDANLHDLSKWALLLIQERRRRSVAFSPAFSRALETRVRLVHANWREYLRYRMNRPYAHEVENTHAAVQWLLRRFHRL